MVRVTQKDERGYYLVGDGIYSDCGTPEKFRGDDVDRLAAYEDTGFEPEEIGALKSREKGLVELLSGVSCGCAVTYTRLRELAQADRMIGKEVWAQAKYLNIFQTKPSLIQRTTIQYVSLLKGGDILFHTQTCAFPLNEIGKTVFLTREEAQADMEGRCVVLPAATVFELTWDAGPECDMICPVSIDGEGQCDFCDHGQMFVYERKCTQELAEQIGKNVFLTREEAEAALKEETV